MFHSVYLLSRNRTQAENTKGQFSNYFNNKTKKTNTALRIFSLDDIRVPFKKEKFIENSKLGKSHFSPYLPQLSDYYLLIPDDIVICLGKLDGFEH